MGVGRVTGSGVMPAVRARPLFPVLPTPPCIPSLSLTSSNAGWASLWAGACSAWATPRTLWLASAATCPSQSPPAPGRWAVIVLSLLSFCQWGDQGVLGLEVYWDLRLALAAAYPRAGAKRNVTCLLVEAQRRVGSGCPTAPACKCPLCFTACACPLYPTHRRRRRQPSCAACRPRRAWCTLLAAHKSERVAGWEVLAECCPKLLCCVLPAHLPSVNACLLCALQRRSAG